MPNSIDEFLKIVGSCFTLITVIISILTLIRAKKSLLNTVNTEYQKHVITRVGDISKALASEFDPSSNNYWANNTDYLYNLIKNISNDFINKSIISPNVGIHNYVIETNPQVMNLMALTHTIKADPFIPKPIRESIEQHISWRARTLNYVYYENINNFIKNLKKDIETEDLEKECINLINSINLELYENKCGISQVEEEVSNLRLYIQDYFEGFLPIRHKYKKYKPIFKEEKVPLIKQYINKFKNWKLHKKV